MQTTNVRRSLLILAILAGILVPGCAVNPVHRAAAKSGWTRWGQDHKPVVPDDTFKTMSAEEQQKHMSMSLYNARLYEQENALRLLTDD